MGWLSFPWFAILTLLTKLSIFTGGLQTELMARKGFEPNPKPSPFGAPDYTCVPDSAYQPPVLERLEKCIGRMR
jgi:hypothetical protein